MHKIRGGRLQVEELLQPDGTDVRTLDDNEKCTRPGQVRFAHQRCQTCGVQRLQPRDSRRHGWIHELFSETSPPAVAPAMRAVVGAGMPHLLAVALWLALAQSCATLALGPHVSFSGRRCRVRAPLLQEASPPALDEPADEPLGSLPPVGNLLTSLDPQLISVVEQDPSTLTLPPTLHAGDKFVELFRSCAPYIKMHQGRTIVLHISSAVLNMPVLFDEAMEVRLGSFSLRVGGGRAEHRLS
eukprot:scaffold4361_cov121-Isochrysis_galbana.AAC.4